MSTELAIQISDLSEHIAKIGQNFFYYSQGVSEDNLLDIKNDMEIALAEIQELMNRIKEGE